MQTATAGLSDGIFEDLFPRGCLVSAFVDLSQLGTAMTTHPDLTPAESRLMAGFRVEKRRRDWLGGRLAAKRAVVRLGELANSDRRQCLRDVEILPDHNREPIVCSSKDRFPDQVQASISHSGQFAGAVACCADQVRIGFDMERAMPIDPALWHFAFGSAEIKELESVPSALRPIAVLVFWTAKEAVSKAIGTGLSVCLQDIQLVPPEGFLLRGTRARRFPAFVRPSGAGPQTTRFQIDYCHRGDYVLSLASCRAVRDQEDVEMPAYEEN